MDDRPRRRRPPTRGLLFGAPLDRRPAGATESTGARATGSPDGPVPIALIGEHTPVAPPRVTPFGAMAATWPLVDRAEALVVSAEAMRPDRREHGVGGPSGDPAGGAELRLGGLSGSERDRMLGR